jgi:hypothetical protein
MNLDCPYAPVREGIMDFFPRAAIISHLEQRGIFSVAHRTRFF